MAPPPQPQKMGPVILHEPIAVESDIRELNRLHGIFITFLVNVDHAS